MEATVTHICVIILCQLWLRQWLFACSTQSHYLNQCLAIVNWTFGNNFQWNPTKNNIFIEQNAFWKVVCKMVSILARPQYVTNVFYDIGTVLVRNDAGKFQRNCKLHLSRVCLTLSQFSQLSFMQYMGLCVFSLPIYLMMIVIIHALKLIIDIIKSEVWPIYHYLGLGHETMVCAVCLSIFWD